MKKNLVFVFLLLSIFGFSQQPAPKVVKNTSNKDTLIYWKGKLLPSKQVDDSLSYIFKKFTDSLRLDYRKISDSLKKTNTKKN